MTKVYSYLGDICTESVFGLIGNCNLKNPNLSFSQRGDLSWSVFLANRPARQIQIHTCNVDPNSSNPKRSMEIKINQM